MQFCSLLVTTTLVAPAGRNRTVANSQTTLYLFVAIGWRKESQRHDRRACLPHHGVSMRRGVPSAVPVVAIKDIAWATGLVEGEGCFTLHHNRYPRITVAMSDYDVVNKLAYLWRATTHTCAITKTSNLVKPCNPKPRCTTYITGCRAVGWMMTMYPLLGSRRGAKVRAIIAKWKELNYRPHIHGRKAMCHPDRRHQAHGLCSACASRKYHNEHR